MLYHITNSKQDTERLGSRFTLPSQLRRALRVFFFPFLVVTSLFLNNGSLCFSLLLFASFFFFWRLATFIFIFLQKNACSESGAFEPRNAFA